MNLSHATLAAAPVPQRPTVASHPVACQETPRSRQAPPGHSSTSNVPRPLSSHFVLDPYRDGMPRRAAGALVPLERDLLRLLAEEPDGDWYGVAISRALSDREATKLLGHGTLYKALDRLERAGCVDSAWELGDASVLGRPLRRLYRIAAAGQRMLANNEQASTAASALRRPKLAPS